MNKPQCQFASLSYKTDELIQYTGYYPYGEPWREPAGQPYLFGGKERMREHGNTEYDFSARRYYSALALWTTPDPRALDFANVSPYTYCSGNPIKYIDPTGQILQFTNSTIEDLQYIVEVFNRASKGLAEFSYSEDGTISMTKNDQAFNESKNTRAKCSVKFIGDIIADEATTSINIANNSTDVLIGDYETKTIDLVDIKNLGTDGPVCDIGALSHECIEQYILQTKPEGPIDNNKANDAHNRANQRESAIVGYTLSNVRIIPGKQYDEKTGILPVPYSKNTEFNNEFYKEIVIHFKDRNVTGKTLRPKIIDVRL